MLVEKFSWIDGAASWHEQKVGPGESQKESSDLKKVDKNNLIKSRSWLRVPFLPSLMGLILHDLCMRLVG